MRLMLASDDDVVARVRSAAPGESLVLVVESGRDPLSLALLRAAIGPLAVERAPARLNAVLADTAAEPADVEAAATWLDRAASTTGQLIEVSAIPASARTAPANR